jgi:hypothetical protein
LLASSWDKSHSQFGIQNQILVSCGYWDTPNFRPQLRWGSAGCFMTKFYSIQFQICINSFNFKFAFILYLKISIIFQFLCAKKTAKTQDSIWLNFRFHRCHYSVNILTIWAFNMTLINNLLTFICWWTQINVNVKALHSTLTSIRKRNSSINITIITELQICLQTTQQILIPGPLNHFSMELYILMLIALNYFAIFPFWEF